MKEFTEKLIGRLEEYQGKIKLHFGNRGDFDFMEVDAVKEIVNELAESYHIHCEQEYMRGYADAEKKLAEEYKVSEMPTGWKENIIERFERVE